MEIIIRKGNNVNVFDAITFSIGPKKTSMLLPNNIPLIMTNNFDEVIIKLNNNENNNNVNINNDSNGNINTNTSNNTNKDNHHSINNNNRHNRCPNCSNELIMQEGCQVCMNCYYSSCSIG